MSATSSPTKRKPVDYSTKSSTIPPSPTTNDTASPVTITPIMTDKRQSDTKPPLRNESVGVISIGSNVSIQGIQAEHAHTMSLDQFPSRAYHSRRADSLRRRGTLSTASSTTTGNDDAEVTRKTTLATLGILETPKKVVPEHYTRKTDGKRHKELRRPTSKLAMHKSVSQEDTLSLTSSRASQDTQSFITNEMEKLKKQNQALRDQLAALSKADSKMGVTPTDVYRAKWNHIKKLTDEIMDRLQLKPAKLVIIDSSKTITHEDENANVKNEIDANTIEIEEVEQAPNKTAVETPSIPSDSRALQEPIQPPTDNREAHTSVASTVSPLKKSLSREILGIFDKFGF